MEFTVLRRLGEKRGRRELDGRLGLFCRLADLDAMSDNDLMIVIFGYDTPELRAAQALERAGDDAGFEKMLFDVVDRDSESRAIQSVRSIQPRLH